MLIYESSIKPLSLTSILTIFRQDDILVDSSFLGVEAHPEEFISYKSKKRRKPVKRTDSVQYNCDSQDSMFSPELQAQIDQLNSGHSSTRQDSKPTKSHFSPELDVQLAQLKSGTEKQRFDSFSENWAELGFGSRLQAEMAYYEQQARKDASEAITARRQRRNTDGSLSAVETSRADSEDEHLSMSERISRKRVSRGKQSVSIGARAEDFN